MLIAAVAPQFALTAQSAMLPVAAGGDLRHRHHRRADPHRPLLHSAKKKLGAPHRPVRGHRGVRDDGSVRGRQLHRRFARARSAHAKAEPRAATRETAEARMGYCVAV